MKRLAFVCLLALSAEVGLSSRLYAQTTSSTTASAQPALLFDVDRQLPAQIDLVVGQKVFFYRSPSLGLEVKVTSSGTVLKDVPATVTNSSGQSQANWPLPTRGRVLAGFEAGKAGTAEVKIESRVVAPGAQTKTRKISVVVKSTPTTHKIEFKTPFPQAIDIAEGDSIILTALFKGDLGLYDREFFTTAKATDGQSGEVLNTLTPVARIDADNIQLRRFDTKRKGEAEIVICNGNGKEIGRIKVTVR